MVIGRVVVAAGHKCHNPASSHASSYVTRGPRKPYTAACAWLRVFRCGARATQRLQRSSVIASKRACVRAREYYIPRQACGALYRHRCETVPVRCAGRALLCSHELSQLFRALNTRTRAARPGTITDCRSSLCCKRVLPFH